MSKNKKKVLYLLLCIIPIIIYFSFDDFLYQQVFNYSDREILIDTSKTNKTILTSVMDKKIEPNKNILYCATAQLAWNKLCNDLNNNICNFEKQPEYVDKLNDLVKVSNFVSEDSYIAIAGFGKDDIVNQINELVSNKFPGKFDKLELTLNPEDTLAFSCLYKELKFEHVYQTFDTKLNFESKEVYVKAFGIKEMTNDIYNKFKDQVKIYYYNTSIHCIKNEFVIELKTKSENDIMIISTIAPEDTLLKSFEMIQQKIHPGIEPYSFQELKIPKFNFNIRHEYKELIGKEILSGKLKGNIINNTLQNIKFKLDEQGVTLASSSILGTSGNSRIIYLNVEGPFIIYLKDNKSDLPYFMAYIGNDELLEKK